MTAGTLGSNVHLAFLNALPSIAALVDKQGTIIGVNAAWRELGITNGLSRSCVGQNYLDICDRAREESAQATATALRRVLSREIAEFTAEYPCQGPQRAYWFSLRISVLEDPLGACALLTHTDITESKVSQSRLHRLRRLYTVLSRISEATVSAIRPEDLYAATCRILVEHGLLQVAMIAELRNGGEVAVVSSYGGTKSFLAQLVVASDDSPLGGGTVGTSLRTGRHDICNDIAKDARMAPWQAITSSHGYAANASFPLKSSDGKTFGCLTLIAAESEYFQGDEISLMLAVAADLAFAVESRTKEQSKRKAQRLLQESEATMAAAQRIAHFGSWELDLLQEDDIDANVLRWSDEMFRIAGLTPQSAAITNEMFFAMVPPDEHHPIRSAVATAVRERGLYSIVHRLIRPDGEERVIHEMAQVIVDQENGKLLKLTGTAHDITEQRLAEEKEQQDRIISRRSELALRESEERYRTTAAQLVKVLDSSLDVICSFDAQGRFLQVNKACESVWGYTAEELLGKAYLDKVLPQDQQTTALQAASIMEGKSVRSFENRFSKKNGEVCHIQWAVNWSQAEQMMFCVARDITEVKANALRIAEQASLLDKAQDAILVRGLDHHISFWNQSAQRVYGWTAEEALNHSVLDLLYRDTTNFLKAQTELMAQGEWVGELEHFTKSGTALTVEVHLTLVLDEMGDPKSVLSIGTDITQRKQLEQQFLRAQRMESLGTLAGGIAHDLNNVLAPILMAIDLLRYDETDPERIDTLELMESSAQRGAEMVSQVLSFARGAPGQRVGVDLRFLFKDVTKIIKDTFPKSFEIVAKTGEDLWPVQANPTQLHQALLNLCVNARDAMPSGGRITLSAENTMIDEHYASMNLEARAGPHLRIEVEDQGFGMDKRLLEQIFDPFFTTKEQGKGTGLGLSTTLAIVKGHGGFLKVYSEPGVGSKFSIYLPADCDGQAPQVADRSLELPSGNGQTVLVIDDEPAILRISKQTLELFGYRALLACDGPEAISLYVKNRQEIAVVVTDMMMPVMDGPATIRVLKRLNPELLVIGASGISTSAMAADAAAAGIGHFLAKPYTSEMLLQALKEILKFRPDGLAEGKAVT